MTQAITRRNSQSIEALRPDVAVAREVSARRSSMVDGGWLPEPIPAPVRAMMERRQGAVLAVLQGATRGELEEEVAALMQGYPSMRNLSRIEAQVLTRKYADDLASIPLWAIRAACKDISGAVIAGLNPDFPPSSARIRQQADEHLERLAREARDLNAVLTAKILPPENPDREANIKLWFQKLQQRMGSRNVRPPPAPVPPQAPTADALAAHYAGHSLGFKKKAAEA